MLYLDFHHHIILVRCNESSLTQKLREEFHFFVSSTAPVPKTIIDLETTPPPPMPSMVAVKILEHAAIYRLGNRQYVDYFGEALMIQDSEENSVKIFSENIDRLYELGFLAIHSILGQKLDQSGLCRIHALAVSLHSTNVIVTLPSKGGKSTLLKTLLENPEIKIISDDMPLCDNSGRIHPFPSKVSLGEIPSEGVLSTLSWHEFRRHHFPPKWTASLSQLKDRLSLLPQENQNLLMAGFRISSGESMLREVPKWKMIMPMMEHMIMGFGLPQIMEMFLKFNLSDIIKLTKHAFIRSVCAFNLVRQARCYYLYLGPDISYNAQIILDLMYDQQNKSAS